MGNNLNELASYMQNKAQLLIDNCAAAGIPIRVVDTGRSPSEQTIKLQTGVSWTKWSKHEPQRPEMKSEAIDIVPIAILEEHKANWDPTSQLWQEIGVIGERLGLLWGGRWATHPDPSHFEWKEPVASGLPDVDAD